MSRELLVEVSIPPCKPNTAFSFQRLARTEVDIATVNVATAVQWDVKHRCTGIRVALGAVAPCPVRARKAEALLEGQLATDSLIRKVAETASDEITPITDVRASAEYRREISRVLVRRALEECLEYLVHESSDKKSRKGVSR
jgi:carbon-monoxide dehydrogenase medium subunit